MAAGGGVDAVDHLGVDLHRSVETEGHIGAIDVVVNGLGQADDVQALLRQQICGLVGAVAAQAQQAVQFQILIGLFHGGHFVDLVLLDDLHHLEGGALGAQDGAAQSEQAAEIVGLHLFVVPVDQPMVAVQDADDLHVVPHADVQRFRHAADGRVQAGTVAAGGQDANTFLHSKPSFPCLGHRPISYV